MKFTSILHQETRE